MAEEQHVTRDQHRADMAELHGELKAEIAGLRHDMTAMRGELKEEIAGIRQDVAVLAKTVEHLAQTVTTGLTDIRREIGDIRQDIRREIGDIRQDMRREMGDMRQDMREIRVTMQRQMWLLIGVVIVTMVGGMIKIVFFP
jgi:ribosomal protein L29